MKLDKNLFKAVVKECLIEILAEGLATPNSTNKKSQIKEQISRQPKTRTLSNLGTYESKTRESTRNANYLDSIKFGNNNSQNTRPNEKIQKLTSTITQDPLMQDILSDTAMTTLQEQAVKTKTAQVTAPPKDKISKIVSESDPTELFGGAAKNWETLAFS